MSIDSPKYTLYLQQAERLGDGLLRVTGLSWPPALPGPGLAHMASLVALRKQLDCGGPKSWASCLVPLSQRLSPGLEEDVGVYCQLITLAQIQVSH